MEISSKESGSMTRQTAKENTGMPMGIIMKASGWMIKLMAKEFILLLMALVILENGKTTCSMDKERKLGKIILILWESIWMGWSTVKELIIMLTALSMKGIGPIIKFMESELTLGKMEKYTQGNGKKEICMDKEYLAGLMEEDTKVNIC